MKKIAIAGLTVFLLTLGTGMSAEAQWGHRGYGSYHSPYRYGSSYRHNSYHYGHSHYGHSPYRHRSWYHDTSHWDYHPGAYVPHGNHYHYIPGHWDYHNTGHWHH